MRLKIAIVGCGAFARNFVELFQAHPYVEEVYVCDCIRERAQEYAGLFHAPVIDSYEEVLKNKEINAVALFTQRHLHGPMAIQALQNGKHVYCAVPMASHPEECHEITELVKKTGLTYMMGETCYYYPCAKFARQVYTQGKLGDFVYGAAQYYHHIDSISYGKRPAERGMPPLLYPTHSTAMILSAVDSYVTEVSCFGYEEKKDACFGKGRNEWDNPFSSEFVMMKLANGGTARVTEGRNFGWMKPSSYISGLYGTKGGYEFSIGQHVLVEKDFTAPEEKVVLTDVSDYVNPIPAVEHKDSPDLRNDLANGKWQWSSQAKIQEKEVLRLPESYRGLRNGHMGTHKFLIDDFCTAAYQGSRPSVDAWMAARYTIPGLTAHQSAMQGGAVRKVFDCGDGDR